MDVRDYITGLRMQQGLPSTGSTSHVATAIEQDICLLNKQLNWAMDGKHWTTAHTIAQDLKVASEALTHMGISV